ncbi:MAG: hypothetical protein IPM77_12125 [Crocinitomicaceae bacterium]|nr:hypothetical protein [Crocinitomicaceae bacterium]
MKTKFTMLVIAVLSSALIFAQPKDNPKQQKEEYIRTQKIAFISTELALTPEEAEKFWPVYNEYDAALEKIREERKGYMKELKTINDLTGERAYELTAAILDTDIKEASIRKEYLAKFAEVLDDKKAAKVFYAEEKFKRELLKEIRNHEGGPPHDGPPPRD